MKIILAPDKFKGSLSSFEVCNCIREGIHQVDDTVEVIALPMADGGDGFASVMQNYLQTTTINCGVEDPLGRPIQASFQWNKSNNTAIIEAAIASGLVLLKKNEYNILQASTRGTGLLIKQAIQLGAQKIILGIGGTATNDAGTGILSALDFHLLNNLKQQLEGNGGNLRNIMYILPPAPMPQVKFEVATDVQNVLYGPEGASFMYARQKGANEETIQLLDEGLKHIANIFKQTTGKDISNIAGAGAAGGIVAGLAAYFPTVIRKGIDIVMDASKFKEILRGADLVITGEGKIDEQTKQGKVVAGIAATASDFSIPVMVFCGNVTVSATQLKRMGIFSAHAISAQSGNLQEAMEQAGRLLTQSVAGVMRNYLQRR